MSSLLKPFTLSVTYRLALYVPKAVFCLMMIFGLAACKETSENTDDYQLADAESACVPQAFDFDADIEDAFITDRLPRIDSAIMRAVDSHLLPNCVTFVAHHGRVVHYKAYGWRDVENRVPCQKDDIFRIASQTKAVCVVAFMTLFEEGRVLLDEPVKKYIPQFANPQVLTKYNAKTKKYSTRPAKRDITIRDLITHTSGLCYDGVFEEICSQKGVYPHLSQDSITLQQNVERMAQMPLAHDPGEAFTYSMNIDVIGALCEIISGQDINTFLHERVLDPLGMTQTWFYLPDDKVDRLVKLYKYTKSQGLQLSDVEKLQSFPYSGAKMLYSTGAGLCGTIEDYAKFCQMILNGGEFNHHRILGRKTLEMMQKNGVGNMRGEIGFGMAWDVFTSENAHNTILSEGSMRWGGMFGTDYVIDPQEDLILLMYTNCMPNYSGLTPKTLLHNVVYQSLR